MSKMQIRAECGDCGVVRLTVSDLLVRVGVESQRWSYCFRCPTCGRANAHDSDETTLDVLVSLGARLETWQVPAELLEPRPIGAVLTLDDLLDFHFLLQRADWFEMLTSAARW
jgi:uncharacterized Zn finger protein